MAEAAANRLVVLMAGKRAGVVGQGEDGRLLLEYEEQWRIAKDATPLSLSMPLARRAHHDAIVRPFLWGAPARQRTRGRAVGAGRQVRLAPLYDLASALPYDDMYLPWLRMAMRVGGEDRVERVGGRHWRRFAEANRLDPDETVARVDALAARTPGCFADAARDDEVRALGSALPARLAERIAAHAVRCRSALARD